MLRARAANLARLIELLPVLDLTWPDEWQAQWWRWVADLMAEGRALNAAIDQLHSTAEHHDHKHND